MRSPAALGNPVQFLGVNEEYNENCAYIWQKKKKVNEKEAGKWGMSKMTDTVGQRGRSRKKNNLGKAT